MMPDPDTNSDRPPTEPSPSDSTAGACQPDDLVSRGAGLESTRGYVPSPSPGHWRDELRLEDLKLDASKNPDGIGRLEHYEILGYVGRGAMGVVLKAFDEQLHRTVAIKVMSPDLLVRPTARERFFREARAAAGINHPNVVTIHAVSEHHGLPYLVMEFVDGVTLADRIQQQVPLPTSDILRMCVQITDGLAAAHRQGVIHRDVKPANILLERGLERVKITDFGLARVAMENSDLTSFGDMVGTPAFMSPEQVDGRALDARSDLFSLGCVIYAMVAGKSPFRAANALASARRVVSDRQASLNRVAPELPKYLSEITDRLLNKRPEDRYESADVLYQELSRRLTEEHLSNDDSSMLLRMTRKSANTLGKQGRAWLAILALAILVLVTIQGFRMWSDRKSVPPVVGTPITTATTSPAAVSKVVTVAADGSADFRRLVDALRRAMPGDTVRVLDAARYESPLRIDSAELFSNVTIEATAGATLATPPGVTTPVIMIQGTPGLHIRGFKIETSGDQHAVEVTGLCPGLRLEHCVLQTTTPVETRVGSMFFHAGAAGTTSEPIRLHNLRIEAGAVGIVVGGPSTELESVSHLAITACDIRGASRDYGIPIVIMNGASDVHVSRNSLSTGTIGINLAFGEAQRATRVSLSRNTFHNLQHFLGFPEVLDQDVTFESNLIVDSAGPLLADGNVSKIQSWLHNNWWELIVESDAGQFRDVLRIVENVSLRSREWGTDDFLVPAADAPLDLPGRFSETSESTRSESVASPRQE